MPRGLGFATATTSAAFFPHCEQRSRNASTLRVNDHPTKRSKFPGVVQCGLEYPNLRDLTLIYPTAGAELMTVEFTYRSHPLRCSISGWKTARAAIVGEDGHVAAVLQRM